MFTKNCVVSPHDHINRIHSVSQLFCTWNLQNNFIRRVNFLASLCFYLGVTL